MRDFVEYLRAYRAYVSANLGWGKALRFVAQTIIHVTATQFGNSSNAFLGYIFAPYRNVETSSHSDCDLKSARPKNSRRCSTRSVRNRGRSQDGSQSPTNRSH